MLDLVRLYIKAGDGGNGRVSFFRNRQVLKGGPNGGNGGDGGSIFVEVDDKLNTLQHFSGLKKFIAENGVLGGRANQIGKKGENVTLKVPRGTVVWLINENKVSLKRRTAHGINGRLSREEAALEKYFVEKETQAPREREADTVDLNSRPDFIKYLQAQIEEDEGQYTPVPEGKLLKLKELKENDDKILLAQGGFGGRGNTSFKGSANTTPMEAEWGSFGEQKMIFLELRLLANIGFVGYPNAGKSSLLSRLTQATPKVANYPFTTLEPNLGIMKLDENRSLVLADIPGLVEGASEGKGLGFKFLRHIQNSKVLTFVLSLDEADIYSQETNEVKALKLWQQYQQLQTELKNYKEDLTLKVSMIVINKVDLYEPELKLALEKIFAEQKLEVLFTSAATGENLPALKQLMWEKFQVSEN